MRNTIAISLLFVGLAIILGGSDAQKPPPKCSTVPKNCARSCTKATATHKKYKDCLKNKPKGCKKNNKLKKKLLGDFNKAAKALKVCMDKPKPTPPKPTRPPTTPRPPPPTTPPPSEKCMELAEAVKNSTEDLEACKATGVDCTEELEKVKMDYKACMDEKCKDCGKDPNEAVDPECLKKVMEAIQDPIADAMMKVTAAAFEAHEKAAECAPPPPPATTPPPPPATTPPAK